MIFSKMVLQPKVAVQVRPPAPPVYRPQAGELQSKRPQLPPQVYRPSRETRPNPAPPVYRPQTHHSQLKPLRTPSVAAHQPGSIQQRLLNAPPVYRPQQVQVRSKFGPASMSAASSPTLSSATTAHSVRTELDRHGRAPRLIQPFSISKPPMPRTSTARTVQPLILTILKAGQQNDALLGMEIDTLEKGYNDHNVTLDDTTISQRQSSSDLRAGSPNEILVLNAHGSNNTVAGRSAQQMANLLTSVGATGFKEIHIYACQAGMSLYNFDQELSTQLDTPVWAPRGNIVYNTGQGRYQVRRMTYNAELGRWVGDGDKEYGADEAWWYSVRGRTIGKGTPPKPGAFPVEEPVDLSQYQFEVVGSGFGK